MADQKVYMFKTSATRLNELLSTQEHFGRVAISVKMLQG